MSHRKASMTMADLEAIHENRAVSAIPTPKDLNEEIFDEICQEVEQDDSNHLLLPQPVPLTSFSQDDSASPLMANNTPLLLLNRTKMTRRHSSYESRVRREHRTQHEEFKAYFQTLTDSHAVRRASFVSNLLEFNLSVSMNSMSDLSQSTKNNNNKSAAMNLSCPVLSYMNDEEEDSVELRLMKRPSMTYVGDDSLDQSWETLKDDSTASDKESGATNREYIIELPPLDDLPASPRPRRRKQRQHSYKMLEQQLNDMSHLQVLKTFNNSKSTSMAAAAARPEASPKSLENNDDMRQAYQQQQQQQPMASHRPVARGA